MTNLSNLVAEVSCQIFYLFLIYLQQGSYLSIIVWICLLRIEGNDVTRLRSVKEFLLILCLDIGRHYHTTLGGDTTFLGVTLLVELTQVTSDRVVTAEHFSLHKLTSL